MPPAYFQSASWGSDSKSADTAKLTLFTHKANEATANRYSRIFDLISCTVLIPKASDPGLSPKIAIPMSCQSNPPASRGDDLRKKHIPTGGDIWSDIWRTYAFVSRFSKNTITATAIALYNPASQHHWISLTLALKLSDELDDKSNIRCSEYKEVQMAVGMIELEWSCHGMGHLRLRNRFLISRDGQFSVIFGQEEELPSIPCQIMQCRRAYNDELLFQKEELPPEEELLEKALEEGVFVEVEEVTSDTKSTTMSLEEISAKLNVVTNNMDKSNQSNSQNPPQVPESISDMYYQSHSSIHGCERSSNRSSDIIQTTSEIERSKRDISISLKNRNGKVGSPTTTNYQAAHTHSFSKQKEMRRRKGSENSFLDSDSDTTGSVDDSMSRVSAATSITLDPPTESLDVLNQPQTSSRQSLFKRVDEPPKLRDCLVPEKQGNEVEAPASLKSDKLLSIKRWLGSEPAMNRHEIIALGLSKKKDCEQAPAKSSTWPLDHRARNAYDAASTVRLSQAREAMRSRNALSAATPSELDEILRLKKADKNLHEVAEDYWIWREDHNDRYHVDPDGTRVWYNLPPGQEPPLVDRS